MYLQITTRCNMTCAHCMMNCYADGEDMDIETVRNALDAFKGDLITIGGGEPTIHPKFWEIFGLVMGASLRTMDGTPFIVTNGTVNDTAIALAALAKKGAIGAALSQDSYHDPIDWEVVEAFKKPKTYRGFYDGDPDDLREIRDVTYNEINAGRCDFGEDVDCPCNGFIVKPNGDVYPCGCDDSPLAGNVNEGFCPSTIDFDGGDQCHKNIVKEEVYA